jgi:hypothetical protein
MTSTPGSNRALLAAAWGLQGGAAGTLVFYSTGFLFWFNIAWCACSVYAAIMCARYVNGYDTELRSPL